MKYKIGIFGSAENNEKNVIKKAQELGHELGKYKDSIILINGAADGLSYEISKTGYEYGLEIWGYSPVTHFKLQKKISPQQNYRIYKKLVYIPSTYIFKDSLQVCRKYRNVTSTATCDAGIIISGRWGTMNEFSNLYDMGKIIGVLTGTDGITDEVDRLNKKFRKKSKAQLIFDNSPRKLLVKLFNLLKH